ncbi:MAG TPA: nucleotidyltransferase family protein [Acidisarcina sp.]|nr:nucleotidyltransferase family protein [Acidisarcina sp.]
MRDLAGQTIDWQEFLEMVVLHRLGPIVYHNLLHYAPDCVPDDIKLVLEQQASSRSMAVFQDLAEVFRLIRLFADASIGMRVLKGLPLAILAYGDAGLRDPGDTDLLIAERDIVAADELLQKAGYIRIEPDVKLTPRRFTYYVRHWKDFVYEHSVRGNAVELHWRLTRNRAMPGTELTRPESLSLVKVGSGEIPALAFDDLFLYLCLHGALDGWMRLKSLADIVAICRNMEPEEIERLANQAQRLGLLPEMTAGLRLATRIFGVRIEGPGLLPDSHPAVRRILKFSLQAISAGDYRLPRESISGRAWAWYEMGLRSSAAYQWQIFQRVLFRPRVWSRFDLPDSLFFLYPLLGPFEWILYHGLPGTAQRNAEL